MTETVYVIQWTYGEYSDRREGIAGIVRDEEIAKQTVLYLQREMQRIGREYLKWSESAPPYDEEFDEGPQPDGYDQLTAEIPDKSISTLSTHLEDIQYSYSAIEVKDTIVDKQLHIDLKTKGAHPDPQTGAEMRSKLDGPVRTTMREYFNK